MLRHIIILVLSFVFLSNINLKAEEDWEINDEIIWKYDSHGNVSDLVINQDSTMLIAICLYSDLTNKIYFFELENGDIIDSITGIKSPRKLIVNNNTLFITSNDSILLLDINTKQILKTFSTDTIKSSLDIGRNLEGYNSTELILKDGFLYNCIVSGGGAFPEKISYLLKYNIETTELVSFKKYYNEWESFDISPDGNFIAMYSVYRYEHDQPRFAIEDLETGDLVWNYYFDYKPTSRSSNQKLKYIENGKYLYLPVGNYEENLRLFDLDNKEFIYINLNESLKYGGDLIKIEEGKYILGYVINPEPYGRISIYDIDNNEILYTSSKISRLKYDIFKIGDYYYGSSGWHITKQILPKLNLSTSNVNEKILYPNPTNGDIIYNFNNPVSGTIHWKLVDINGVEILSKSEYFGFGDNTLKLNISHLSNGVYFLKFGNNTAKVVLEK